MARTKIWKDVVAKLEQTKLQVPAAKGINLLNVKLAVMNQDC